ncbi:hypothetical protein J2W68_000302 [Luteimonas terrae]|uniref:Glutaredoxin family protein n=1 Tax=Luteimonas terrae TaxID=1530191 RepID=A0ABU1XTP2_9GAMM|nr:hypothetical protein [Luteimonas terrae]
MTAPTLILYQRDDCHLCDLALDVLAQGRAPAFDSVFIDDDPRLEARYGERVPVLRDATRGVELDWPFDVARLRLWLAAAALVVLPTGASAGMPPAVGDVDFANTGGIARAEASPWIGKRLVDILAVDDIDRIVLTKAATSAPGDVDLRNIREMLRAASSPARAEDLQGRFGLLQLGHPASTWEGLLLMRAGAILGFFIDDEVICLRGAAGEVACWRR